jgi:hypothetical protein
MTNDVSFKRPEYIEALDRWMTVRDVCAGQHRVVDRLPYINRHDKTEENIERNKSYRERAVYKNATGHTDWSAAERDRVNGAIRQGFYEGQTSFQVIRKIRGIKAAAYSDGSLTTTSCNASTVVHTAVQHVGLKRGWRRSRRIPTLCPRSRWSPLWTARRASNAGWTSAGFLSTQGQGRHFTQIAGQPSSQ